MSGIDWTYGQVRNYVQGSGCTRGDDRIEVMMIACLQEIWTEVCDDPHYAHTETVDLAAGNSEVDIAIFGTVSSVKMNYGDGLCRKLSLATDIPEFKSCGCKSTDETCDHGTGTPDAFEIIGDTLTVTPTPDEDVTIELTGYKEVDCTLFDVVDDVRVWRSVDLPQRYQTQLANLLLAKFYAEEGNFAASTFWEQKVSTGLVSLLDKRNNRYSDDGGKPKQRGIEHKLIRRGSDKECREYDDCWNPGIVQRIETTVTVDCYGDPVE